VRWRPKRPHPMHLLPLGVSSLLLMVTALAQAKPAAPAMRFHLPAGTHAVEQLLALVAQAVRSPVVTGAGVSIAELEPLRLQCDLSLSAADWEDGLSALLETRGLVVTFDAANRRHEVMAIPAKMANWLHERAQPMTLEQLAARPGVRGPVRVVVPTKQPADRLVHLLRPFLARRPVALASRVEGDTLVLTSLAANVRFAMGVFVGFDPSLANVWPTGMPLPWPRAGVGDHRLAAGDYTIGELVDALAQRLGRNILMLAAVAESATKIHVAEPITGDSLVFEAKLTALLWQSQVLVLELSAQLGLHEAVHVADAHNLPAHRSQPMSSRELLARPELVALVRVHCELDQKSVQAAMTRIRALWAQGAGASVTVGAAEGGLMCEGLSVQLLPMLQHGTATPETDKK
jgi:hypothetical protein